MELTMNLYTSTMGSLHYRGNEADNAHTPITVVLIEAESSHS